VIGIHSTASDIFSVTKSLTIS